MEQIIERAQVPVETVFKRVVQFPRQVGERSRCWTVIKRVVQFPRQVQFPAHVEVPVPHEVIRAQDVAAPVEVIHTDAPVPIEQIVVEVVQIPVYVTKTGSTCSGPADGYLLKS